MGHNRYLGHKMRKLHERDEAVAYRVCDLYLDGPKELTRKEIVQIVKEEMNAEINLETIHDYLQYGRESGWIRLVPPECEHLRAQLLKKFDLQRRFELEGNELTVVNVQDHRLDNAWSGEHVAATGAEVVAGLIHKLRPLHSKSTWTSIEPVRIGLGSGRATRDFSRHLSQLIQSAPIGEFPPIELIAISAGCPARSPQYAPASFFNLFPRTDAIKFVGLFAETIVRADQISEISRRPGVAEAFALRDKIDIVVTAMGDPKDTHDLLTVFLREANVKIPDNWVGNVQYRPYTSDAPAIESGDAFRALTVFELEDFMHMAKSKNRHVVLLARQCGVCNKSRATALYPLLTKMKVWSRCIMDTATATDLCKM